MTVKNSSSIEPLQKLVEWLKRRDWLFWCTFIPLVFVKLAIFHYAASLFLLYDGHPMFGMHFEIVEAFADFSFYYMEFVTRFVQGYLPYTPELYEIGGIQTYIYPPLYLYILTGFYFIPSEFLFPDIQITALTLAKDLNFLRVGFAFIFFDLATIVVMYAAARELSDNRFIPVIVMLFFALNPVSLWWGNYLWLSTPIHTFFLVLGFYFMIRGKFRWAIVWVTMAAMTKQTAGLLIPVIWFLELRKGLKQLGISVGITALIGVILSMPYLIIFPTAYFEGLTAGLGGYWFYDTLPAVTHPIPVSILAFWWPEPAKFIVFQLVFNGFLWMISLLFLWLISYLIPEEPQSTYLEQLLLIALLISLAAHIFFARGIYKFYLIALIPFLILFGAILRGPLIPVQNVSNPVAPRTANYLAYLPLWMVDIFHEFRVRCMGLVNNVATWWFFLVGLASISIFGVHRFYTHVILLAIFALLLIYGGYHYVWKWQKQRKAAKTVQAKLEEDKK